MDSNILLVLLIITSQTDKLKKVRMVKSLLSNSFDSYLALLNYRATPLPWYSLSPAELLMGRVIRTVVSQHTSAFQPNWPYLKNFRETEKKYRDDRTRNYDKRYRTRSLPELPQNTPVWVDMPNGQVQWTIARAQILQGNSAIWRSSLKPFSSEKEDLRELWSCNKW